MSRLELASIPSLTFYKGSSTASRRTSPLPQLVCQGAPCKLYSPEAVRCVNLGGFGTEVDWKCEADLPESLRFGRVEVSCEGWSRPGDPYVLKGSCSLEYRLIHVPGEFRNSQSGLESYDWLSILFSVIWTAFLIFISYNFFLSCFRRNSTRDSRPASSGPRPWTPGSSGGWFPGGMDDHQAPPPYTKNPSEPANQGWRPGFWTGAAMGGLANHLFNRRGPPEPVPHSRWDWEQPRASIFTGRRPSRPDPSDDRGEGTSGLGAMRRSTGLGGSNVR